MNLENKVVVITGGGGILCSDFAKHIAKFKARIAILDLNLELAQKVADEIKQDGGIALAYKVDVLNKKSIEDAHQCILKEFGKCDILINGAGGNHPLGTTSNEYMSEEDLEKKEGNISFFDLDQKGVGFVFDLNFMGTLLPSQVFAYDMLQNKKGVILNISSMNAYTPLTKIPAYSGAKAAVTNFTQWLAVHMSQVGVRVNAIAPGFFLTKQNEKLLIDEKGKYTARALKIINSTPMGRMGENKELLGTLMYLIDDEASAFVTGVTIPVDGGFSAYSGV